MAVVDDLITAKANIAAKLAEISVNPKPSYSIEGQSVSHVEFYKFLTEQITALNEAIQAEQPFEIRTRGRPA